MGDECAVHLDQAGDLPVELRVARGRGNAAPYNAPMDLIDIGANLTHDSFDHDRNEVIQSFQGNRNPFIDHPEWATNALFTSTKPATCQLN